MASLLIFHRALQNPNQRARDTTLAEEITVTVIPIASANRFKVAEFFAGVGLAKVGLERSNFEVVWSNDFDARKSRVFKAIHGAAHPLDMRDVALVHGNDIPTIDLAWASFPCTDLSQAGKRGGIRGSSSGAYWHFSRILREMGSRIPSLVAIENVGGFGSGNEGRDLSAVLNDLKALGYSVDVVPVDAATFLPQSRPRLFIVGVLSRLLVDIPAGRSGSLASRPPGLSNYLSEALVAHAPSLPLFAGEKPSLTSLLTRSQGIAASAWWDAERTALALDSLSPRQLNRIIALRDGESIEYRTGYRRMRNAQPTWEFRADDIAGCLRTPKGGSSVQAVLRAGNGAVSIRWMTPGEYAMLMGMDSSITAHFSRSDQLWAYGDAVCVPVVEWLARNYFASMLSKVLDNGRQKAFGIAD